MDYLKNYTINLEHDRQIRNIGRKETVTGTTLAKLTKLGFEGVDASLETSLFEYGMAWLEKDGEWHFIYATDLSQGRFDNASFSEEEGKDWRESFNFIDDADYEGVLSYVGLTEEEFESLPFSQKVNDLTSYYGYMNIFGESHWGQFYIFKDGRNRVVEWFEWVNGVHAF